MNNFAQQKIHQKIRFAMVALVLTVGCMPAAGLAETLVQIWAARYNGPANTGDLATANAVDSGGNILVTGKSASDTVTIKYNARGNEVWVARYIGGQKPMDVAVDANGNVYVTGPVVTVKYNANGLQMWEMPVQGDFLAVDTAGNVYVSGGVGGTVKLNATGAQQWASPIVGKNLAVDAAGNVYVGGGSTVKLDPNNGNKLWEAPISSSGSSYTDHPTLAVDASGNVYVTGDYVGFGSVTAKFDTNGNRLWMTAYSGSAYALAVDTGGNVYVVSSTGMSVTKYGVMGNLLWVSSYNASYASGLVADASGNVYVSGGVSNDFLTVKYNSAGVVTAAARYDGGLSWDDTYAISMDAKGDVYVSGESFKNTNGFVYSDFATIKYSISKK